MTKISKYSMAVAFLVQLTIFGVAAAEPTKLEITTQGFLADTPQEGIIRNFPRLRVRVEAAHRIEKLIIKERSYEVDLASTRDKGNLSLFGLDHTPRTYTDVTINLEPYINEKIEAEGEYELQVEVVDRNDKTVQKKIYLLVHNEAPEQEPSAVKEVGLLETGSFTFQRTGTGSVDGAGEFGIEWQNISNSNVSIRLAQSGGNNSNIVVLDESDFVQLQTIDQLAQKVAGLEKAEAIVLATANNGAAGKVFSVMHADKHYIFRISYSSAHPSGQGTKVTLEGEFKSGAEIDY